MNSGNLICYSSLGQSPRQKKLISDHPKGKALYVEGAFRIWLRGNQINYFVLRGEGVAPLPAPGSNPDDITNITNWVVGEGPKPEDAACFLAPERSVHEQEDSTILAVCATGTSTKDSLLSWIRLLQRENPDLEGVPVLFALTSPLGPVVPVDGNKVEVTTVT